MTDMLRFDPAAAFLPETGLEHADVAGLSPQLEKLRDEICDIDVKMLAGDIPTPDSKQPLDAGHADVAQAVVPPEKFLLGFS